VTPCSDLRPKPDVVLDCNFGLDRRVPGIIVELSSVSPEWANMKMKARENSQLSEDRIIKAIKQHLAHMSDYSFWKVGVTSDPERCQQMHDYPAFWCYWHAETQDAAGRIKDYFLAKGMNEAPTDHVNPTYVYIF